MRSLKEINKDIDHHTKAIAKLKQEIVDFQDKCPHPDPFLSVTHKDYFDEAGAPVYEETYSKAHCSLCDKYRSVNYDAREGTSYFKQRNYKTAREVMDGKT